MREKKIDGNQHLYYANIEGEKAKIKQANDGALHEMEVQKRAKCEHCGYESQYKHDVAKHINAVHKRIKKHSCYDCDYKTASRSNLNRHINAKHKQ